MRRPHYLQCSGEYWLKQRMRALVRDHFTCQWEGGCTEYDSGPETRLAFLVVHHLCPRINGGTHALDNLVTLCRKHHADIHPHLRFELAAPEKNLGSHCLREL